MKNNIKNYLAYRWWIYLLTGLVSTSIIVTVFDVAATPKDKEKITIAYIGSGVNHISLQKDINSNLSNITKDEIKKVYVENSIVTNSYDFNTVMRSRNSSGVEIFVIEKTVLDEYEVDIPSYFGKMDTDAFNQYFVSPILINEDIYGVNINKESKFASFYKGTSTLEMYFNINSINNQCLFDKGENDTGAKIASYLLK